MKYFVIVIIFISTIFSHDTISVTELVDNQIEAYNSRNINAFAALYHDSVEVYNFPNKLSYRGKDILIERYGKLFKSMKKLKAVSLNRLVLGNKVVDLEETQRYEKNTKRPDRVSKVIVIYEIEDGLIRRVQFCR